MRSHEEKFIHVIERLIADGDLAETVTTIMDYVVTTFRTEHVGCTLSHRQGSRFESLGATSTTAGMADNAQHVLGEGPCVEAATEAGSLWSGDLLGDRRWPTWGARAASTGLRSVLSTELRGGGTKIGSLNIYGEQVDQFDAEDAEIARELAQHAVIALIASRRLANIETALETRTLIGQAQGVLMERHDIDASAAFSVLRRYSQHQNIKLRQVAEQVIRRRRDLAPLDDDTPQIS